jgi:hypothetical protein
MDATEVQVPYKIVLQDIICSGFQKINVLWTVEWKNAFINIVEM